MPTIVILSALTIILFTITVVMYMLYSRLKAKSDNSNEKAELAAIRKKLELAIGAADLSIWSYSCEDQVFNALYGKLRTETKARYHLLLDYIVEPYRTNFAAAIARLTDSYSQKEVTICKVFT